MAEKKMTRKDYFMRLMEVIEEARVEDAIDLNEFLLHQLDLLEHKSSSSAQDLKRAENNILKQEIVNALTAASNPLTITDIIRTDVVFDGVSNQKMAQLLSQLIKAGVVQRIKKGKGVSFALA